MKSLSRPHLVAAILTLGAFSVSSALAQSEKPAPPTPAEPPAAPTPPPAAPAPAVPAAPEFPTAQWADIREYSFDQRATFFSGLKAVEAKVDAQIAELEAKRAAMDPATDTRDWDQAMKEMVMARADLKAASEEIRKAKPQVWNEQKDKVGQAWTRTQDASTKVKLSTAVAS